MVVAKETMKSNQILDLFWRQTRWDFLIDWMWGRTVRGDVRVFDLSSGRMALLSTGGEDCGWQGEDQALFLTCET